MNDFNHDTNMVEILAMDFGGNVSEDVLTFLSETEQKRKPSALFSKLSTLS